MYDANASTIRLVVDSAGNLGLGTISPAAKLEVNGSIKLSSGSRASLIFADGTVQSTAWTGSSSSGSADITDTSGQVGVGTTQPRSVLTLANPSQDGAGTFAQGLLFVDTVNGTNGGAWAHAAIYTSGSIGYNGDLIFATDGDNVSNVNPTEKVRILSGGNVGIGTSTPQYLLDVAGTLAVNGIPVLDRTHISTPSDGTYVIASSPRIHGEYIVTFEAGNRVQTVHLLINANQYDGFSTIQILGNHSYSGNTVMSNFRLLRSADWSNQALVMDVANRNGGTSVSMQYQGAAQYGASFGGTLVGTEVLNGYLGFTSLDANVGIGVASPSAKLEVNGSVKLTNGSGASITFADGTIQSTAWSGTLCGGDYAESVNITGERSSYEPGDALVVDPGNPGHFLKAAEPYSTLVAGIYSTKPGLVGRRQAGDPKTASTEVPMAMVGIVPTKVSAENGPIKPGDLLVTSSTLGYVMKGTDRSQLAGAIIGKALGALPAGKGVIEVLVTLQ